MSFRVRLLLGLGTLALVPLAVMSIGVRREMVKRLTAEYQRRATALVELIDARVVREGTAISGRLRGITTAIADDNRLRAAVLQGGSSDRSYLLDYAAGAMRLTGLSMLQIQDENGRILSSGHFRNEFDRLEPQLPDRLAASAATAIIGARRPEGPFLALASVDSARLGNRRLSVVGGVEVDPEFLRQLVGGGPATVALVVPDIRLFSDSVPFREWSDSVATASSDVIVRTISLPYVQAGSPTPGNDATFVLWYGLDELHALRASVDRWFVGVIGVTVAATLLVVMWLAARLSRPLVHLAQQTQAIDLDQLDVDVDTGRADEIGALARVLDAMTQRLRSSVGRLREAERRAAMGEVARQVNHDIKNGLVPIRNVVRHLAEVAAREPPHLVHVFEERKATLESSVAYLETLAGKYARLSPAVERGPCDLNGLVRDVVRTLSSKTAPAVRIELGSDVPLVAGDGVAVRRIVENLVHNALESLEDASSAVTVRTSVSVPHGLAPRVRLEVADMGTGMTESELERAFDDFYTTKPSGTGLGLSIVRRLVLDLDGSLRVESEPSVGTRVIVELPALGGETGGSTERRLPDGGNGPPSQPSDRPSSGAEREGS